MTYPKHKPSTLTTAKCKEKAISMGYVKTQHVRADTLSHCQIKCKKVNYGIDGEEKKSLN